ncbi:DUF6504 family protein [Anaerosoma tenue]|mgnify:FL=1|uniref:DUF6504 family protein n=1 Tax=Anaerosoma tenue TaxID=2933588 RepID=UPI002261024B|nr:DUF6504 family protein [Anaerosoma tenue]MCK8114145.1 class I SAM-dependent methyltransferase [Anaerosoma tenue]
MGRNRAIRQYDPRATGESLDLFTASDTRTPVILELLRSPWIVRGSELGGGVSGLAGKRRERAVEVVWDASRGAPRSFTADARRYSIDAVVQSWAVERAWWDPRKRLSRRCYRVLARGGLYDLAYDRIADRWMLTGVVD